MRQALLLLSIFCVFAVGAQDSASDKLAEAPHWELTDASGNKVSSKDFAGKPLVIHFWATWCPYCKKLQPGLNKLYKKYADQGLEMIAISFWEDEGATPEAELASRGISFKTLVNGDEVARQKFGVKGTPTTIFIDKQNRIIASTRISDPNDIRLEQAVKQLLKK